MVVPRIFLAAVGLLASTCTAFQLPTASVIRSAPYCSYAHVVQLPVAAAGAASRAHCEMNGEGGGFMEQMKAAKDMFNPENMKKYAALGEKIQKLQAELAQTEVEVATNDGAVIVKTSAMQVPISVEVSEDMVAKGSETVSKEVANALKQAHAKSGTYMNQRMAELYQELGLATPGGPAP